jgi:hypothetical protein
MSFYTLNKLIYLITFFFKRFLAGLNPATLFPTASSRNPISLSPFHYYCFSILIVRPMLSPSCVVSETKGSVVGPLLLPRFLLACGTTSCFQQHGTMTIFSFEV